MTPITALFHAYGPEYSERSANVPYSHLTTIQAICACRTAAYGTSLSPCQSCGHHRISHACGHRHCPQCPHRKTPLWLHNHLATQLPGPHFLRTFTIPETLRPLSRSHPRLAYHALFQASSEALKRLAKDERFIGTDLPGFPGILHTWGRQLQSHPHLHDIVPGGGLSKQRDQWLPSRSNFSVPVKALSPISRAVFTQEMAQAECLQLIDPQVWNTSWNVQSQANPNGSLALTYLAPYVFKVAMSNRRLVGLKDRIVTFTSRKPGSNRPRTIRLAVIECIRRFLHHVLPTGFMKVRHVGFVHPNCTINTQDIRRLITPQNATPSTPAHAPSTPAPDVLCPTCGAPMRMVSRVMPWHTGFRDTG